MKTVGQRAHQLDNIIREIGAQTARSRKLCEAIRALRPTLMQRLCEFVTDPLKAIRARKDTPSTAPEMGGE